jgi:hypothetical protein
VQKQQLADKLFKHIGPVEAVATSNDGAWCASARAGRVRIFDRVRKKATAEGSTYRGLVAAKMLFTPNGKTLVTVGRALGCSPLFVWDWQSSGEMRGAT